MTDHRIIAGSLVDVRNVGTHKSVKLTIHVAEEQAMHVIERLGWPTGVHPIAVAIARMDTELPQRMRPPTAVETTPRPAPTMANAPVGDDKPQKSPAQVAGYLCTVQAFQRFLRDKYLDAWEEVWLAESPPADNAAACVRHLCNVDSRADLTDKNVEWNALRLAYQLWLNQPELDVA